MKQQIRRWKSYEIENWVKTQSRWNIALFIGRVLKAKPGFCAKSLGQRLAQSVWGIVKKDSVLGGNNGEMWLERKRKVKSVEPHTTTTTTTKLLQSCPADSVRPHRWQPTRLRRAWDSPCKNTRVGCHFLLQCMKVKSQSEVAQSSPTLSDPVDCSPPGSSVYGIFQARVLEWSAIAFSSTVS